MRKPFSSADRLLSINLAKMRSCSPHQYGRRTLAAEIIADRSVRLSSLRSAPAGEEMWCPRAFHAVLTASQRARVVGHSAGPASFARPCRQGHREPRHHPFAVPSHRACGRFWIQATNRQVRQKPHPLSVSAEMPRLRLSWSPESPPPPRTCCRIFCGSNIYYLLFFRPNGNLRIPSQLVLVFLGAKWATAPGVASRTIPSTSFSGDPLQSTEQPQILQNGAGPLWRRSSLFPRDVGIVS